jgi:hypothetical protein
LSRSIASATPPAGRSLRLRHVARGLGWPRGALLENLGRICILVGSEHTPSMGTLIRLRKQEKAWQERFEPGAPKPGDVAPDFELRDVDGDNPIRLSDYRGKKPVALIFGSYT